MLHGSVLLSQCILRQERRWWAVCLCDDGLFGPRRHTSAPDTEVRVQRPWVDSFFGQMRHKASHARRVKALTLRAVNVAIGARGGSRDREARGASRSWAAGGAVASCATAISPRHSRCFSAGWCEKRKSVGRNENVSACFPASVGLPRASTSLS